jgi:predicted nucleic acid-binding protein
VILVVDASAVIDGLVGSLDGAAHSVMAEIEAGDVAAPNVIDVEILHVLRKLERRKELSEAEADQARELFLGMRITRYETYGLANRIWTLRHNLTCYDAAYVALAEALEAPILTCDAKMAGATGHNAEIRLYGD